MEGAASSDIAIPERLAIVLQEQLADLDGLRLEDSDACLEPSVDDIKLGLQLGTGPPGGRQSCRGNLQILD
jgi:hypothetical protein